MDYPNPGERWHKIEDQVIKIRGPRANAYGSVSISDWAVRVRVWKRMEAGTEQVTVYLSSITPPEELRRGWAERAMLFAWRNHISGRDVGAWYFYLDDPRSGELYKIEFDQPESGRYIVHKKSRVVSRDEVEKRIGSIIRWELHPQG